MRTYSISSVSFCGPSSRTDYSSNSSSTDTSSYGGNTYRYKSGYNNKEKISNRAVRNLATRHPVQYEQFVNTLDDASKKVAAEVKRTIKHRK